MPGPPDGGTLAFQRTDVTGVEVLSISDPAHPERPPQTWPYPRPGRKNAEGTLGLIPAGGGATTWVRWDRGRHPYLATVVSERNAPLAILVQNRAQTEDVLLAVDVATGATTPLLTERDPAWINLFPGMPRWREDGRSFLWMTGRAGAPQLELRGRDGRLLHALTPPEPGLRALAGLDEARGMAWVRSGGEDPLQAHLDRIPLDPRRGRRARATEAPGHHDMVLSENGAVYVHTLSPRAWPASWTVRRRDGQARGALRSVAETPLITPRPEYVTAGDSLRCRAMILRPRDLPAPGAAGRRVSAADAARDR